MALSLLVLWKQREYCLLWRAMNTLPKLDESLGLFRITGCTEGLDYPVAMGFVDHVNTDKLPDLLRFLRMNMG
jgi:hypothetical protein